MHVTALFMCTLIVMSFSDTAAGQGPINRVGKGERLVVGSPRPAFEWTPGELALRDAMNADPNFDFNHTDPRRADAIEAYQWLLQRDDLTKEQEAFAWWRLGALYVYNLDPRLGEKPDYEKGEDAYIKARKLFGDLVSFESLNSATVYGSLPGEPAVRTRRLAESFNWLMSLGNEDIDRSAETVNKLGQVLHKKYYSNIAYRPTTLEERKKYLRNLLADYRGTITKNISETIKYGRDPEAIGQLLKSIQESADPQQMAKWREMYSQLKDRLAKEAEERRNRKGRTNASPAIESNTVS